MTLMTHNDVVQTIVSLYPGVEFNYDGDGSSLGPVSDNGVLLSRGLEWYGPGKGPKMADLEAALSAAQAEAALVALKQARDAMLTASDWTQISDSPLDEATKALWVTYRQALRAWTDLGGFDPLDPPAWPVAPA